MEWTEEEINRIDTVHNTISLNIEKEGNKKHEAHFIWDGNSYELTADSETWQQKRLLDAIIEKIHQKYAHNMIMIESMKHGFNHTDTNILQDGSLRIVLERWKS